MTKTEKWWFLRGCDDLNAVLIGATSDNHQRLKGVGNVPISNLIDVPKYADRKELADLAHDEGLNAIFWKFSSNPEDCDVLLKL